MIFEELKERVHNNYNSNFHIESLPWGVKIWLIHLCDIVDEKLAEKEDTLTAKNEKRWEEAEQ